MALQDNDITASSQPDLELVERLAGVENVCLTIVAVLTLVVLAGWLAPPLALLLPVGWSLLSPSSAVSFLLATASLALSQPARSRSQLKVSQLLAIITIIIAATVSLQILLYSPFDLDRLLGFDADKLLPNRPSLQGSAYLALLGLSLVLARTRKNWLSHVADAATLGLIALVLVVLAGYVFGVANLYGQSEQTRVPLHALLAMTLLAYVRFMRRAEYGVFTVLLGTGIGSQFARLTLPFALALPFVLDFAVHNAVSSGWLTAATAQALSAAVSSLFLIGAGVYLAWHINRLERRLRDMSLTDDLTQVYNLRGFRFLGEQTLREAQRTRATLTLLYIDLDDLKRINDAFGHDAGSRCICDVASLLRDYMRSSDIIARIGGDEFAVVFHGSFADAAPALQRMRNAAAALGRAGARPYTISYSVGEAAYDAEGHESFDSLVARADAAMYAQKQQTKAGR